MPKKLKINIIIPFTMKTGGIAVILEYYCQLTRFGHEVNIYYPLFPYKQSFDPNQSFIFRIIYQFLIFVKKVLNKTKLISWYFEPVPIIPVPVVNNFFVKDADIVMATSWPTAYDVNRLNIKKGVKYFFIQGYEVWDSWKGLAEKSYLLPLKKITISPWLSDIIKTKYNQNIEAEILNGIRLDKFYPPELRNPEPITILVMYDKLECKGVEETLIALKQIKSYYPDIHIIMFGMYNSPRLDFAFEYHKNPVHSLLLSLYQRAHIFIFPSRGEGWGMTPVEAMACKCAVIGTPVGSVNYLNDGRSIMNIEINNPDSIYKSVEMLIKNRSAITKFAENGYSLVSKMDWEISARKIETVFFGDISKKM